MVYNWQQTNWPVFKGNLHEIRITQRHQLRKKTFRETLQRSKMLNASAVGEDAQQRH